MKKLFVPALAFFSCSSAPFSFTGIDTFNRQDNALENGEEVEVLAVSGGPDSNEKLAYYYHYMVVSLASGDTVNVLSTFLLSGISEHNRVFNFISVNDPATRILHNLDRLEPGTTGHISDMQLKPIRQVVVNADMDMLSPKYPTVIGSLGTLTGPDSLRQP